MHLDLGSSEPLSVLNFENLKLESNDLKHAWLIFGWYWPCFSWWFSIKGLCKLGDFGGMWGPPTPAEYLLEALEYAIWAIMIIPKLKKHVNKIHHDHPQNQDPPDCLGSLKTMSYLSSTRASVATSLSPRRRCWSKVPAACRPWRARASVMRTNLYWQMRIA